MDESTSSENTGTLDALKTTPRKRLGRPPKASQQPITIRAGAPTITEEWKTEILTEQLLTDSPTISECRRSSRKKIIKFDVRDLLNKNRKGNKVQIETRLDTNVDLPPNASTPSSTCMFGIFESESAKPAAYADPKEAAVLESSSESPLSSSDNLFAMPKQTHCQIVSQECNTETILTGNQEQYKSPVQRKRGRPRKLEEVVPSKDAVESNDGSAQTINSSDSDTNSTTASAESDACSDCSLQTKLMSKLRVSLKRMSMLTNQSFSDSGESKKGISLPINVTELPSSPPTCTLLQTIGEPSDLMSQGDTEEPAGTQMDIKTDTINVLSTVVDKSKIETKFIGEETDPTPNKSITDVQSSTDNGNVVTVLPQELLKLDSETVLCGAVPYDNQQELEPQTAIDIVGKQFAEGQFVQDNGNQSKESPVATIKRRSKRTTLRGSALSVIGSKMTLEETFAKIAAASSKIFPESSSAEGAQQEQPIVANTDLIEDNSNKSNSPNITCVQSESQSKTISELETLESTIHTVQSETDADLATLETNHTTVKASPIETSEGPEEKCEQVLNVLVTPHQDDSNTIPERSPSSSQPAANVEESQSSNSAMSSCSTSEEVLEPVINTSELNPQLERNAESSGATECSTPTASLAEKPSASVSITACDALFRAIDKASVQVRQGYKNKKKLKLEKHAAKLELELENNQRNTSRNTICEEHTEGSPTLLTNSRRNSQSYKPLASPEDAVKTESMVKAKLRNMSRKGSTIKRPSSQESVDSSSNAAQCALKCKSNNRTNEALQSALTDTESSESTSSGSKVPICGIPTPTAEMDVPNELTDLAQFIEDGVKLLDRDLKPEDTEQPMSPNVLPDEDYARRVANIETPATTPPSSPQPNIDDLPVTGANGGAVRRSHRIKQKPQLAKGTVVGRAASSHPSSSISMEEQLAELAHIDAINEQFLRQEGLNTFQPLRDNYYRCARQISQENAEMQCDCFLTGDEEAMGQLTCGSGCINRMLMIECGPLCTNGDRCTNKRFQQHQCWPCRVFRTEKKGCGITAELQIPPGEFIMEYVGEVIDSEEFERRQHLYSRDRNRHYYFMALRGEAIIDATAKGNISRYINHSCDPNAETQKWTVNGELRIGFFSVKTIQPGEEITFDYQYQRYGRDAQRCYCEAANCRGWIGGEPDSDEGEQIDAESDSEAEDLTEELDEQDEADKKILKAKAVKSMKPKPSKTSKLSTSARRKQQKPKDREYKAGRWLRPSGRGSGSGEKSSSRKPDQLEDPDVLEQLSILNRSGLKNQADTLRFSRCMVRAKLLETRLQLLGVLTRGELPCRRLFLDYHGLRLLHAWISESGSDNQLRLALIEALESLPIPNKTMLNDSRVYQRLQLWSTDLSDVHNQDLGGEQQPQLGPELEQDAMRNRIEALLQKWSALPEIFRIPKRERIEQMKEHEREADRQHYPTTALEDSKSNSASDALNTDRYRQDRFRRDTTSRYEKPKSIRIIGNNTICSTSNQLKERNANGEGSTGIGGIFHGISKSDPRRRSDQTVGSDYDTRRTISKKLRRSLFERKVAQDEAEKRVYCGDWREHEVRREYFGADLNTDPKLLPYYQNTETLEWFNSEDVPVPGPLRCGKLIDPTSPETGDGVEYKLPAGVEPLPPSWHWSLTSDGDIYYYNLRDRISQWEPPNAEQRLQQLIDDSPDPEKLAEKNQLADELIDIDVDYVGNLSEKSLTQYIEVKVRERRELRRKRLVSIRMISPRREEDRLYNQMESRKYKENKEKIRRRKEIFRRNQLEPNKAEPMLSQVEDVLPIQGYLYSSDEDVEPDTANVTADCAALPLLDVIVDSTKNTVVDELEALTRCPIKKGTLDAANVEPNTSKVVTKPQSTFSEKEADVLAHIKRKLLTKSQSANSQKKHRGEREKKRKTSLSTTSSGREACEKFRFEISGHVAEFLRPYRKDNCQLGRITCDEDYKFLIKRLSHHITTKEMRYCDSIGNPLACTESVKSKSYEFINQYMRKKGRVYKKPTDEPDY